MGLIKAAIGALGGTLGDTWKEEIHCGSIDNKTLLKVGTKMHEGSARTSNTKGTENYISNGSAIMVETGTCMLTVDNGKITNIVTEPGRYILDNSSAPSIFAGNIKDSLKDLLSRFTYGGTPAAEQKVVYINLQEIPGIPFGTSEPMPYFDPYYNTSIELRCFGRFSVQIPDAEAAVRFYTEVAPKGVDVGDLSVTAVFSNGQYKSEFIQALLGGLAELSEQGVMYSRIQTKLVPLAQATAKNAVDWQERGLVIKSVGFEGPVTLSEASKKLLGARLEADTQLDDRVQKAMMNKSIAAGIEAMGSNEGSGGGMMGVMGMGQMMNMGANLMGSYNTQPQQPTPTNGGAAAPVGGWKCPTCGAQNADTANFCSGCGAKKPAPPESWVCPSCGANNTTNFCSNCGAKKGEAAPAPAAPAAWKCECGAENTTKFCSNCGKPKPAAPKKYKCDKCGWVPGDPEKPPKFCPECGDLFDENDVQ